jgi:retinol-binding protein 3
MKYIVSVLLVLIILICDDINAQQTLTPKEASGIIDLLGDEMRKNYLYQEKVVVIETRLMAIKQAWSTENTEVNPNDFLQEVNAVLMSETGDQHLKFYYDLEKFNMFNSSDNERIDSLEKEQYRKVNFGIQKFEILGGNIAYLKLNKFQQLDDVQEVLMGAVQMMSNADAVILDLRNNGGGDGRTKEFLYSFFLNEAQWKARKNQEFFGWNEIKEFKKSVSNSARMEKVPLCVLTGNGTFSAAEGFCHDVQVVQRARIVGVKTRGGGHSGSSVALDKGFLVFIPTSGKESDIEGKGVMPDCSVSESLAFWKAQELIIADLKKECRDTVCSENLTWVEQTARAMMNSNNGDQKIDKKHLGKYSKGFVISKQGNEIWVEQHQMGLRSALVPIEENYWMAKDLEDYGLGNYRIRFLEGGRAKLYVNLGIKMAELDIVKD